MSRIAGPLRQIGIVTRDADAVMLHWAQTLGVGPFFVIPEVEHERYRYYGKPAKAPVIRCGLAQSGPLQVEVIQQLNDAPSVYRDFLAGGKEGMQHMSSWPDTAVRYDAIHAGLLADGLELAQEGYMSAYDLRYAYFGRGHGAAAMPFIEISEALKVPEIAGMFAELERLNDGWDGKHPLRIMG